MQHIKRILAALLVVGMLAGCMAGLTGCGNDTDYSAKSRSAQRSIDEGRKRLEDQQKEYDELRRRLDDLQNMY